MDNDTDEHDGVKRPDTLPIHQKKGESKAASLARTATSPALGATLALRAIHQKAGSPYLEVELGALLGGLTRTTNDDTATGTDRLMAQAVVLDGLFTHLTGVAMRAEYVSGVAPALTLALQRRHSAGRRCGP